MFCLLLVNFIQGFKSLLDLCLLDIFKRNFKLEPAEVQLYMAIITIPWSFKIFYGFSTDNFDVF